MMFPPASMKPWLLSVSLVLEPRLVCVPFNSNVGMYSLTVVF